MCYIVRRKKLCTFEASSCHTKPLLPDRFAFCTARKAGQFFQGEIAASPHVIMVFVGASLFPSNV